MEGSVYIEDVFNEVCDRVDAKIFTKLGFHVYHMFGHPLEIVNRLQVMSESPTHKDKKFPLIMLFTDVPTTKKRGFYGTANLQVAIANITQREYLAEERLANNFKPILEPIKLEFLRQLRRHQQLTTPDIFLYTEIRHYYWGKDGLYGGAKNIFNDYIDAIELQDLAVTINEYICLTLSNNI